MEEKIIRLKEIDSTNRFLRELKDEQEDEMVVAVADFQTAGKGQGSHTWERTCSSASRCILVGYLFANSSCSPWLVPSPSRKHLKHTWMALR